MYYRAYGGENRRSGFEAFFAHVPAYVVKPLAGKMPSAFGLPSGHTAFSHRQSLHNAYTACEKSLESASAALPLVRLYENIACLCATCAILHLVICTWLCNAMAAFKFVCRNKVTSMGDV